MSRSLRVRRRVVRRAVRRLRVEAGMTLLEILIVLAILALVMGLLVGPAVFNALQDSKTDVARATAKKLAPISRGSGERQSASASSAPVVGRPYVVPEGKFKGAKVKFLGLREDKENIAVHELREEHTDPTGKTRPAGAKIQMAVSRKLVSPQTWSGMVRRGEV